MGHLLGLLLIGYAIILSSIYSVQCDKTRRVLFAYQLSFALLAFNNLSVPSNAESDQIPEQVSAITALGIRTQTMRSLGTCYADDAVLRSYLRCIANDNSDIQTVSIVGLAQLQYNLLAYSTDSVHCKDKEQCIIGRNPRK